MWAVFPFLQCFSLTSLSCLFDVESVSNEEEVGVDEAESVRHHLFHSGAWVEHKLDPALSSPMSNVVLQWSSDFALAGKGAVDEPV